MYSPKEFEGEVDHSFFDSDSEAQNSIVRQSNTKKEPNPDGTPELNGKVKDGSSAPENKAQDASNKEEKETQLKEFSRLDVPREEMQENSSKFMDHFTIRKEECETNNGEEPSITTDETGRDNKDDPEREDSDASSRRSTPLPYSDKSESSRGSKSDDSSSLRSSSESSDEDDGDQKSAKRSLKKPASKSRPRSHSASSSSDGNSPTSSRQSPAAHHNLSSRLRTTSGKHKQRMKSTEAGDSEDTITDVTPLSTPEVSPRRPVVLMDESIGTADGQHQKDVADQDSGKAMCSDTHEKKGSGSRKTSQHISSPSCASVSSKRSNSGRHRENYSFTSEEVKRIERENQRLLLQLSRSSSRPTSRSTRRSTSPPVRLYHTALNRQHEQQRIKKENLAFLKRLEAVKPTPGMTRSEQLADYQRQAGYLGIHVPQISPTSGKSSRPSSTTRPDTAKPSRSTVPRPDWS